MTHPLLDEAIKKAAVAWVTVGDGPATGLWCLPLDGALYVVCGSGEQRAPHLPEATTATVRLRGDHGGLIVTWSAVVRRIAPGTEEWDTVAPQLAAKRLNASGTAAELAERWAARCAVVQLSPDQQAPLAGSDLPDTSQAAPPRDTPARRQVRRPLRLHRVRRPR